MALDRELRMLGHDKRVLVIGAHPDDEDTELLTVLVRGMGAEAAYLSLNRGEGGQNLIGPELGEALGLLRTEELLAARRLDGARQYFTRAYDFGFSKTLDETWPHWPRDTILKDVVRIVRRFRPQIIVSIFSGTPRDGHGQHQAAGWAAREAFRAAGDSHPVPGARAGGGARAVGAAQALPQHPVRHRRHDRCARGWRARPRGRASPITRSRWPGRSLHRSQDMGQLQGLGPSLVRLALLEDRTGAGGRAVRRGRYASAGARRSAPLGPARTPRACWPCGVAGRRPRCPRRSWRTSTGRSWRPRACVCDARSDDDRVIAGQRVAVDARVLEHRRAPHTVDGVARGRAGHRGGRRCGTAATRPRRAPRSRRLAVTVRPTRRADRAVLSASAAASTAVYDWSARRPRRARRAVRRRPSCAAAFVLDGAAVISRVR